MNTGHVLCCEDHMRTLCGSDVDLDAACPDCLPLVFGDHCPLGKECFG